MKNTKTQPTVKVLKVGYFRWIKKGESCRASCTISLVRHGKIKMIVDTANAIDKVAIIRALKKEKLTPGQITHVVNTHGHGDHIGCNFLFNRAKLISLGEIQEKDRYSLYDGDLDLTKYIKIIDTSGHTDADCTVLVKNDSGVTAIVGDLFWQAQNDNPYFFNNEITGPVSKVDLNKSRKHILQLANYIVPGHGKMFKVK